MAMGGASSEARPALAGPMYVPMPVDLRFHQKARSQAELRERERAPVYGPSLSLLGAMECFGTPSSAAGTPTSGEKRPVSRRTTDTSTDIASLGHVEDDAFSRDIASIGDASTRMSFSCGISEDVLRMRSSANLGVELRWWTRSRQLLLCPLTQFPISLLPYPPFKFRVEYGKPSPHKLVDGKYLAMQLIVGGHITVCGRALQASDISALDEYIHRCKLGPYRPGRAVALAQAVDDAGSPEDKADARAELERFRAAARAELGRVCRIQSNRLLQVHKQDQKHDQKSRGNGASQRCGGGRVQQQHRAQKKPA